MEFPVQIILRSITDFSILFFKDINHSDDAPSHWFIVIPVSDKDSFLITFITSQTENKEKYYGRINPKAIKGLVYINNDIFSFLSKKSVIDCNKAEYLSVNELKERIDIKKPYRVEKEKIPLYLKREIISAINQSPMVERYIKKIALSLFSE